MWYDHDIYGVIYSIEMQEIQLYINSKRDKLEKAPVQWNLNILYYYSQAWIKKIKVFLATQADFMDKDKVSMHKWMQLCLSGGGEKLSTL